MNKYQIITNCKIGKNTKVYAFVNLYDCEIGSDSIVGTFVEIQRGAKIGNRNKIQSHTFICEGVTTEDDVFIGHHVVFINDKYPRSVSELGTLKNNNDWELRTTIVKKGASIGSNATILSGITIGENALVGAGSVVTKDVPAGHIVTGVPAKKTK